MAITIVDKDKRVLITEAEVDEKFLGKFVLVDRTGVPETHDGGYLIAYGDLAEGVDRELFDYGQNMNPKISVCIMSGLAERGGNLWISRNF